MTPFLKDIAAKILLQSASGKNPLYVVLPNRRSGLFLKKHLADLSEQPIFAPKILSIEDFLTEISGIQIEDPLYLLFDLYEIHKQHETENLRPFKDFIGFGEMILRDFNEMDMYLVETNQLFAWLSEEKAIALWNIDGHPLTEYQQNYLAFFKALHVYYKQLNIVLEAKQKAYQGKVYRYASEHINELTHFLAEKEIIIAGFNALTASEKKIFQFLERSGKAQIYWDTDEYYMDSPIQEAGSFLRKYKEEFANLKNFGEHFKTPKNIEIVGAAENMLQAKFAGEKLKQFSAENQTILPEDVVVVLADENLLLPVLNSLPEEVKDVNVTMGYSFRFTPIHNLVAIWLNMFIHAERNSRRRFYFKDVLPVLTHPYIQELLGKNAKSKITEAFSAIDKFYLAIDDLENLFTKTNLDFNKINFLFNFPPNADALISMLEKFSILLLEKANETIDKEFLLSFRKLVLHFAEANEQYHAFDSIRSLAGIYMAMANKLKIPFYGEPLKGLQIMGLLETRTLDFKNIILLSANEGILPGGKKLHSLIPTDIRKDFGLPVYRDHDAIYAYHFYRLLQQTSEATLIYNADSGGMGNKSEKSRFLKQLQVEMPLYNPDIKITEKILTVSSGANSSAKPIIIVKDDAILTRLKSRAQKGFSPTALNRYLACPLRFYFAEVLKIPEPEDFSESIDQKMLGTVIHKVLEDIFNPENFTQGKVEPEKITYSQDEVFSLLQNAFEAERHSAEELERGKNKIFINIAQKMVSRFLKKQQLLAKKSDLIIIGLEKDLLQHLTIKVNEEPLEVALYGKADRIDKQDGTLRIVDYKTGNVQDRELKMDDLSILSDFKTDKISEKLFQLLTYSYLCYKQEEYFEQKSFVSGIYSFRKLENELIAAEVNKTTELSDTEMAAFEGFLVQLLEEIFDDKKTFKQTTDKKKCTYCNFISLCGK